MTEELEGSLNKVEIHEIVKKQKDFFRSRNTLDLTFRLKQLKTLHNLIHDHEQEIIDALHSDFRKCAFETYGTEIALSLHEIRYFLRNLPKLMKPEKVKSSIASFPAKSYIYYEPYGTSLILGAWNYPVYLLIAPLTGSMASGNCVILKPSELTSHTSSLLNKMISETFPSEYICVVEGGPETSGELINQPFDHIFFTGSERVGRIVYEAAAKNLTPCVLESGGKSPCIVDEDADIELAARRIVWGKFLNGGQTCVAPDYVYAHKNIKQKLIEKIIQYTIKHFGDDPKQSPDFPRIINKRNFERLSALMKCGKIVLGGVTDKDENYISPTILDEISWKDVVMQEEIFGPLLPVMSFETLEVALEEIKNRSKPLALYYFSKNRKKQSQILKEVPFGGGCINGVLFQFGSPTIPVGGVGGSGIGKYHGRESFLTFSNKKGVVRKITKLDFAFIYPPYKGKLNLLKFIFKL